MLKGIIISAVCNAGSVLLDLQLFYFREKYFSKENPLLDTTLFFMLMTPFAVIALICNCLIPTQPKLKKIFNVKFACEHVYFSITKFSKSNIKLF